MVPVFEWPTIQKPDVFDIWILNVSIIQMSGFWIPTDDWQEYQTSQFFKIPL